MLWLSYFFILFISFVASSYLWNAYKNVNITLIPFLVFLVFILIGLIDFGPIWYKRASARMLGKKVVQTEKGGSIFQGYKGLEFEIKIDK